MTVSVAATQRMTPSDDLPTPNRARFRVNPNVVAQHMGGDIVLVHLRTNQICELTDASARAWDLLTTGADKASVVAALESEFDVDPAQLRAELDDFLTVLVERELIDVHDDR